MADYPALWSSDEIAAWPQAVLVALRERLRKVRYDAAFIARCESIAARELDAIRMPVVHAWLRAQSRDMSQEHAAAAICARLFSYRDRVSKSEIQTALGDIGNWLCEQRWLVEDVDGGYRSTVRVMPFMDLWLASDEAVADQDPVMGPGATTFELAQAMDEPHYLSVLDVGCGAGSLALVAKARKAGRVLGVDLDPRAVAWARLNAALNELDVEFRCGDLLAPVHDERFDRIVSQPPFVTQPASIAATTYMHGGARGDELAFRLLSELPKHLCPGGRALVLFDVLIPEEKPLLERVHAALDSDAIGVLLHVFRGLDIHRMAIGYAAESTSTIDSGFAKRVHDYREHLEALGAKGCVHALLSLEAPGPGQRLPSAELRHQRSRCLGAESLERSRRALHLANLSDAELLELHIGIAAGAWLIHEQRLALQSELLLRVRFDEKLGLDDLALSEASAQLVQLFVEKPKLHSACEQFAELCGASIEDVRAGVLQFVRENLLSGLFEQVC